MSINKTNQVSDTFNPTGSIIIMPCDIVPSGYLACDGAFIDRSTYANLFYVIGGTYGTEKDIGKDVSMSQIDGKYSGHVDYSWADGVWSLKSGVNNDDFNSIKLIINSRRNVFYIKSVGKIAYQWDTHEGTYSIDNIGSHNNGEISLRDMSVFQIRIKKDGTDMTLNYYFTGNNSNNKATLSRESSLVERKFQLPNFQGMFLRGHGGAGEHQTTNYGVKQEDAGRNVKGSFSVRQMEDYDSTIQEFKDSFYYSGASGAVNSIKKNTAIKPHQDVMSFDASRSWGSSHTAKEFRPINYAVHYCIKY